MIALTAMAMKADEEKSQNAGCDAYLAKPLRYQELYATIDATAWRIRLMTGARDDPHRRRRGAQPRLLDVLLQPEGYTR